jgi:hypothetical protein
MLLSSECIHEAGHAIVAIEYGFGVKRMQSRSVELSIPRMRPTPGGIYQIFLSTGVLSTEAWLTNDYEKLIDVRLAGWAAEEALSSKSSDFRFVGITRVFSADASRERVMRAKKDLEDIAKMFDSNEIKSRLLMAIELVTSETALPGFRYENQLADCDYGTRNIFFCLQNRRNWLRDSFFGGTARRLVLQKLAGEIDRKGRLSRVEVLATIRRTEASLGFRVRKLLDGKRSGKGQIL